MCGLNRKKAGAIIDRRPNNIKMSLTDNCCIQVTYQSAILWNHCLNKLYLHSVKSIDNPTTKNQSDLMISFE